MYKSTMIIQYVINTLPYFYAGITPPQVPAKNVKSKKPTIKMNYNYNI